MLTITDCFKANSLEQSALTIANKIAFNQRGGYAISADQMNYWEAQPCSENGLRKLYNQLKSNVGDYQSKAFEAASLQNNIYTVIYLAQYTDEPSGVWVTISFDSSQKIAGLYFISPKLQQAQ